MAASKEAASVSFEPIGADGWADVVLYTRARLEPRIAAYAAQPAAGARKARLKAALSRLPGLGARLAPVERSFWIVSGGRRAGLHQSARIAAEATATLHLQLVILDEALRGTGAADAVIDFVEGEARREGCAKVDLFVDRRNYRAYHFYRRRGYAVQAERRFVFEVPRASRPSIRALRALPWHAAAALFGSASAARFGGQGWALLAGGTLAMALSGAEAPEAIEAAVNTAFRETLARSIQVSLRSEGDVPNGTLIAVMHRMERAVS
jgi:ribosomal protein S18 acetylase RimI-like enzyme